MDTRIVSPDDLTEAVSFLKKGIPIAIPTETVYGLAAPVFFSEAILRVFSIKGRPSDNPLIAHVSSLDQAALLGENLPSSFFRLAERFWPGPLALVVQRKREVPPVVSAGQPTIAIRMPKHPAALRLLQEFGEPLAAPSANLSGRPSPTKAADVLEDLDGKIPLIVDGGECHIGIESTVLNLASPQPILLRPGAITIGELEEALGQKILLPEKGTPIQSPGMKYRHYAPKAKLRLLYDLRDSQGGFLLTRVSARSLYADLRRADRLGVSTIEIYCGLDVQKDPALMNRLLRASGQIS
jgi:L-threonylcarbamoyladenylate synthase